MSPRITPVRGSLLAAGAAAALGGGGAVTAASAPVTAPAAPVVAEPQLPDPTEVLRLSGPDRYGTAAAIAREFPEDATDTVLIASGEVFPDALTAQLPGSLSSADLAAGQRATAEALQSDGAGLPAPMLLTRPLALPEATISALEDLSPSTIVIIGGDEDLRPGIGLCLVNFRSGKIG